MKPIVSKTDHGFQLLLEGKPVRTPLGTTFSSWFETIIDEAGSDILRFGLDPMFSLSMFSLQASYLDYGLASTIGQIIEDLVYCLESDLFFDPPAPSFAATRPRVGPETTTPEAFRSGLASLQRRQLISVVMASDHLGSAVLGWKVVSGQANPIPLIPTFCFAQKKPPIRLPNLPVERGQSQPSAIPVRSGNRCESPCAPPHCHRPAVELTRCETWIALDKLLRFSKFPEEGESS